MLTTFTSFNFKSADIAAEERNYFGHHVPLVKDLPGLRLYVIAKLRVSAGAPPAFYRAAILTFDDEAAMTNALEQSSVAEPLRADREGHLADLRWYLMESEAIVPFEPRKPGEDCFVMAAQFDLQLHGMTLADAERRYLDHHTHIARRLPGLRGYLAGRLLERGGKSPERFRMALLMFDTIDAFREAYRSPVGQELLKDEQTTIANPVVYRLDATVQI